MENLIKNGISLYVYGEPGCGKSFRAREIADKLGMSTKEINAHEYMALETVIGWKNPINGEWVDTGTEKQYRDGGMLIIDEYDNFPTSTQTGFNALLDSKSYEFNGVLVPRHPNFVVVATGNTAGKGATSEYPSRNPMDLSTLNRFVSIQMTYDFELESRVFGTAYATVGREMRRYSKNKGLRMLVTMRTYKAWKIWEGDLRDMLKATVTKGIVPNESLVLDDLVKIWTSYYIEDIKTVPEPKTSSAIAMMPKAKKKPVGIAEPEPNGVTYAAEPMSVDLAMAFLEEKMPMYKDQHLAFGGTQTRAQLAEQMVYEYYGNGGDAKILTKLLNGKMWLARWRSEGDRVTK